MPTLFRRLGTTSHVSPLRRRLQAAGLEDVTSLMRLARMERAEPVVRSLAEVGRSVEPTNRFWSCLLEELPDRSRIPSGVLPHSTRFVAMTGITREGRGIRSQWIRPQEVY
jgi:hypothetical protein